MYVLQVQLVLLVCLGHLVSFVFFYLKEAFQIGYTSISIYIYMYMLIFVFTGPKGDRGFKGDQGESGITVRTSESISSTRAESEPFFISFL